MGNEGGGEYATLLPIPGENVSSINDKVTTKFTLAYSAIGEHFQFGQAVDADPADFEFVKKFEKLVRSFWLRSKSRFTDQV